MQSTRTPSGPEDSIATCAGVDPHQVVGVEWQRRAIDVNRAGAAQSHVELLLP